MMYSNEKDNDNELEEAEVQLSRDVEQEVLTGIASNLLCWPVLLVVSGYIAYKFNVCWVPYYFIDEVFHVEQTRKYILGQWNSWDSKITTPPGLYIIGWLYYKAMRVLCSLSMLTLLRSSNLIGGLFVWSWVVLRPIYFYNAIGFWPITLIIFPLLSPYYFLYYTDIWSTILVVESLVLGVTLPFGDKWSIWASSVVGLISCLFRQTNIIWNGFIMVVVIERRAIIHKDFNNLRFNNYLKFLLYGIENFNSLVVPYLINAILFAVFFYFNGSIALGDKDNHVVTFHLIQLFYCLLFLIFLSIPIWFSFSSITRYFSHISLRPVRTLFELIGIMLIINMFTVIHPFLLADNRHLTFYLLRKFIARNRFFKYILMPTIYHFCTFIYFEITRPSTIFFHSILPIKLKCTSELPLKLTHISWTALMLCTFAILVPSPLFEPRYYILPYIFWRLFINASPEPFFWRGREPNNRLGNTKRLMIEFIWFILINMVIILIFSKYSFPWATEPNPQRIIW